MNELNNVVTATGTYNSIPTSLTSNTAVVHLIEGLELTIEADKPNWVTGDLTYTITLTNNTSTAYVSPTITDTINVGIVSLLKDSIEVDGTKLEQSQYTYAEDTGLLTINLTNVEPSTHTTLTFCVTKKS